MVVAPRARWLRRLTVGYCLVPFVLVAGCDGGGGVTTPPAPVDNVVARIDVTPAGPLSVVSGATTTLSATAFARDGHSLGSGGISWASSNQGTASVSSGVVTGALMGSATITATSGSVSSSAVSITVTAGAPAKLGVRTQPAEASAGAAFTTQPVVEVQDAAGNLVTTSTLPVAVSLASGGGTLSGTASTTAVGGVATFSGLSIAGLVGPRTLQFAATGVSAATSSSFILAAGVPSSLALRTQPVAGTAYTVFTTPAAVEIRDASGNLTTSTAAITAALSSGTGTLGGSATVNAVAGVATFSTLTVNGAAGARVLTFSGTGLTSVASASFAVASAPPATIAMSPSPVAIGATRGTNPAATQVAVTNTGVFPLTNLLVQGITYGAGASGWLSTSWVGAADAPATLRLTAASSALALGTYTATVTLAGDGAVSTAALTVTLTISTNINTYGTSANKVSLLGISSTLSPGLVTSSSGVPIATDATVTYTSRSTAVATVDASGRITGVGQGQAWVVANSTQLNRDSVLVIVPRASGAILKANLTTFVARVGDTITVRMQLDTRSVPVGAITATLSWSYYTNTGQYGSLYFLDVSTAGSAMSPTTTVDTNLQVMRLTGASAAGANGVLELAVLRFRVLKSGPTSLFLNTVELLGADLANLLPTVTNTQYPVIVP